MGIKTGQTQLRSAMLGYCTLPAHCNNHPNCSFPGLAFARQREALRAPKSGTPLVGFPWGALV